MKNSSGNSDSLLIEKAKNGNEGAFEFLMTKYYPCLLYTSDAADE